MESETYTEVTSDAGEMFFVKVLSDAWHVFAGSNRQRWRQQLPPPVRNRRVETKKEAAVSASVCQLAPGSGESIKPRASCSTRSSFAGRVATTGVRAVVWAADPQ